MRRLRPHPKLTGNTNKSTGARFPVYYCAGRYAKGNCPARATIRATYLDDYVEQAVLDTLGEADSILAKALETSEAADAAARVVDAAAHELTLYLQADLISVVGADAFRAGVHRRQQRLDEATAGLAQIRVTNVLGDDLLPTDLLHAWPDLTIPERRTIMHGLLDRVLPRTRPNMRPQPHTLSDRTTIILRGGNTLD